MKRKEGEIYRRKDSPFWSFWYLDAKGRRRAMSAKTKDERVARRRLDGKLQQVKQEKATGIQSGPLTVEGLADRWISDRRRRGIDSAGDEETRLKKHALPAIGKLLLHEIRPGHIRALNRDLKASHVLAPRTVRHVYGTLHTLFEDAVADELMDSNPCTLKRGELPKKRDKNPLWRSGAVFSREEREAMMFDPRVPADRRVWNALKHLTGIRDGEAAAATWKRYDPKKKPLGSLLIAESFKTKGKKLKGTKTEMARLVPVHPRLAAILAEWKLSGWATFMGRKPGPDDLIVPNANGTHRTNSQTWKRLQKDLAKLGLDRRRSHDTRRTFISLALADGARKDVLRWVTHAPDADVVNDYTTLPWEALCEAVACQRVGVTQPLRFSDSGGKSDG